jgi:dihydroneopterin triphosphate diphosphatase
MEVGLPGDARLMAQAQYKVPESVLVVIHTGDLQVLLLHRTDKAGYWQSVTGSLDFEEELPEEAAVREVAEETGLDARRFRLRDWNIENRFAIYDWRLPLYRPGVTHNTEHVFGLTVPADCTVTLAPREHVEHQWLPFQLAAEKCFSWSNRDAILLLPQMHRVLQE